MAFLGPPAPPITGPGASCPVQPPYPIPRQNRLWILIPSSRSRTPWVGFQESQNWPKALFDNLSADALHMADAFRISNLRYKLVSVQQVLSKTCKSLAITLDEQTIDSWTPKPESNAEVLRVIRDLSEHV